MVLNHVAQVEGFIVGKVATIEVVLDGRRDFLEGVPARSTLNSFEIAPAATRHPDRCHATLSVLPVLERIANHMALDPM
jgi:hypothetical protein